MCLFERERQIERKKGRKKERRTKRDGKISEGDQSLIYVKQFN